MAFVVTDVSMGLCVSPSRLFILPLPVSSSFPFLLRSYPFSEPKVVTTAN